MRDLTELLNSVSGHECKQTAREQGQTQQKAYQLA